MNRYSLTHLSHGALVQGLKALVVRDRTTTAELLAHVAEVDLRKLFLPAGYPSMFAWCVEGLGMSEDCAGKRIQVARAGRKFPALFEAIADGRLHLTGAGLLAPHLTEASASELISSAMGRTKLQIEQLVADRFPKPDLPDRIVAIPTTSVIPQHAPAHVEVTNAWSSQPSVQRSEPDSNLIRPVLTAPAPTVIQRPRVAPLGAERYGLQVTLRRVTHEKLRRLQELLGHRVAAGDLDAVLEHAFDAAISQIEKRKLGATDKPRRAMPSREPRHIPARVKRAVWTRDQGRCAFVGDNGRRCEARRDLEFDHIWPVACGGESTVANVRLLCRPHNQLVAERAFGHEFMNGKRPGVVEARAAGG